MLCLTTKAKLYIILAANCVSYCHFCNQSVLKTQKIVANSNQNINYVLIKKKKKTLLKTEESLKHTIKF